MNKIVKTSEQVFSLRYFNCILLAILCVIQHWNFKFSKGSSTPEFQIKSQFDMIPLIYRQKTPLCSGFQFFYLITVYFAGPHIPVYFQIISLEVSQKEPYHLVIIVGKIENDQQFLTAKLIQHLAFNSEAKHSKCVYKQTNKQFRVNEESTFQ